MSVSEVVVVLTLPVNSVEPKPTATRPKLPNDELELVRSHCPPLPAKIPISQLIVKIETNWAYPLFVSETPIPASLYWVNESHTIDFKSAPIVEAVAWSPSIFIPILLLIKLVQFLIYGLLHLPDVPSVAGPDAINPDAANFAGSVGGNATAAQSVWAIDTLEPAKFRFSIKHPLLTWNTSLVTLLGTIVTNLKSCPVIETSVRRPIGLFSK